MTRSCRSRYLASFALFALTLPAVAADGPEIVSAWARATPPGASVGAVYLTLQGGSQSDRLTGASSRRASSVELHTVEQVDGVARMRPLGSLEIPSATRVELAPGGHHLMLMGLDAPLVAGDTVVVVLEFASIGDIPVEAEIRPAVPAADHAHH